MNEKLIRQVMVELFDLAITEKKNDRFGRVVKQKTLYLDNLVDLAVARGTDLNPTSFKSSYEIISDIAIEQIANGASVNFGLGNFHLKVNGVFFGNNAKWDSDIHELSVHVTPSSELRKAVKTCKVDVRGMASSPMAVNKVTDVASGEVDSKLTPGGGVNVEGTRIKIEGEHADVGIKLVNEATEEETLVPMTSVLENSPSSLRFIVPAGLESGDYTLIISTQHSSARALLKEPRVYIFEYLLAVD